MKNTLVCSNISIFKGNKLIIHDVGFCLMPNACVRLVGENGSGKTSILRCIARLDQTNAGTITYNDCIVDDYINEYKQIILYISDKEQLSCELMVYEVLDFWASLYDSTILLHAAIETFSLNEVLDIKIKFLSKGFKKRVILSRLLLQRARIWLLDEPFVNIDISHTEILINIMNNHLSNGGIVMFSDHIRDNIDYKSKDVAELKNIGYIIKCSQLDKQETKLVIKDFKNF